jgi:hypothetical protein
MAMLRKYTFYFRIYNKLRTPFIITPVIIIPTIHITRSH